ncbi:hypothetical protein CAPTEDRAFT_186487 [Capitella teleta]|uniref:Uncharacterized protein n=1 Tax=Capitella teleta TaxID=283909 RepID=R7TXM6_CAPTE|nr:hypothetical protein CAPTEDRAFT_186487 [Capitella teleta]|eukprot:ELT98327.1 hypothetical protein CAPTEDRAFT_186487 [Capitella teleta]
MFIVSHHTRDLVDFCSSNGLDMCCDLDAYYDNIVKACLDAAEGTVGCRRKRRGNTSLRSPGWKDHVEPHRDRAIFWYALWKSSGSPHDGHVADIRRRTRARYRYAVRYVKRHYRYAVRYVKRHEEQCIANKLAEALAKGRGRDIWNEVQKISGRKINRVAMVDGMVDDRDIGELFARKISEVFNAVDYDVDRMDSMLASLKVTYVHDVLVHSATIITRYREEELVKNGL